MSIPVPDPRPPIEEAEADTGPTTTPRYHHQRPPTGSGRRDSGKKVNSGTFRRASGSLCHAIMSVVFFENACSIFVYLFLFFFIFYYTLTRQSAWNCSCFYVSSSQSCFFFVLLFLCSVWEIWCLNAMSKHYFLLLLLLYRPCHVLSYYYCIHCYHRYRVEHNRTKFFFFITIFF